jgi:heat-inducible transcriptional repressor
MKKNENRQLNVLKYLVEEYINTYEPVSSKLICEGYIPEASPATIRIDLNRLEKTNLIYQPHTSAGRIPTVQGYRKYLELMTNELAEIAYDKSMFLRDILINYYKDTPLALHYIMQLLARETDQLSFVAEPEVSSGFLQNLEVFKILDNKLLFVVSLDSGLDKTVIINWDYGITNQQLKTIVRYMNEEFMGLRLYDIQNKYIEELAETVSEENKLLKAFLEELQKALSQISSFFIHFDGSIHFLEQPEFNEKSAILSFLGFIQRQDHLVNLMQTHNQSNEYNVLLGEDLGHPDMLNNAFIFSRYEIFGIPGYLGVIGPMRMNYKRYIPMIRDIAKTISDTTKKGMMVFQNERKK